MRVCPLANPIAAEYSICLQWPSSFLIRGTVARLYIAIASGSPWVVSYWDNNVLPSTKSSAGSLYVLISAFAMGGQILLKLGRASCLFRELNVFEASTSNIASVSSFSKAALVACTAASIPGTWLPHSCWQPLASWISPFSSWVIDFAMNLLAVSPIPVTPGFFYQWQWGSLLGVHGAIAVGST